MAIEAVTATIVHAEIVDDALVVSLSDGRVLSMPLSWYPVLQAASAPARAALRTSPFGVHWDALDEDVGLAGMLAGKRDCSRRPRRDADLHDQPAVTPQTT